jgi:signal peptidase I
MNNHKLRVFILVIVGVMLLKTFVFEGLVVRGDSMYPTLQSGDYVLINRLAYLFGEPERGDVVVARTRGGDGAESHRVVKRVKGLPGERFPDRDGVKTNVDPNEYFIVGDNGEVSVDSNDFGFVDKWEIEGRAFGAIRIKNLKYIGL